MRKRKAALRIAVMKTLLCEKFPNLSNPILRSMQQSLLLNLPRQKKALTETDQTLMRNHILIRLTKPSGNQPDNPKTTSHQPSTCPQQQERSPISNILAPETQHKPKENELNRKNRSQEEQIETKDDATEDNAKEEYLNTLGMGWGANVLTDSVVNDDTLKDSTQPDHTRDLKTDPAEDPTTPMDEAPVEVAN